MDHSTIVSALFFPLFLSLKERARGNKGGGCKRGIKNVAFILFIRSVLKLLKSDMWIFPAQRLFAGAGVSQFAFGMRLVCVCAVERASVCESKKLIKIEGEREVKEL